MGKGHEVRGQHGLESDSILSQINYNKTTTKSRAGDEAMNCESGGGDMLIADVRVKASTALLGLWPAGRKGSQTVTSCKVSELSSGARLVVCACGTSWALWVGDSDAT